MSYKELQTALKNLRQSGVTVNVKLNATKAVLQAEYDRIMAGQQESNTETKVDELEQLRQELAEAKLLIAQQQRTIADLEDTIQQMQA